MIAGANTDLLRQLADLERRVRRLEALDSLGGEAGSMTPTYYGGTTAGVTTYTFRYGAYVRVGSVLLYSVRVQWSNATGTGNARVGGFPYAAATPSQHVAAAWSANIAFTSAGLHAYFGDGLNYLELYDITTAGAPIVAVDTAGDLILSGHYFI